MGGTYTDAVLTDGRQIIAKKKFPTKPEDLLASLTGALDAVTEGLDLSSVKRVVFSTTLVTNIIAEKKYPPVALVLVPGPGISHSEYKFDTLTHIISGAIDFRGREIVPLQLKEIDKAAGDIIDKGYDRAAVVGKFSCRNNKHEVAINDYISGKYPSLVTQMGHSVSGQLNFPRRIATTMLTLATRDVFSAFIDSVNESLQARNITAPAFILKADGGTLPLEAARRMPVETIFSGPAASTLGAMSLAPKGQTSVVVDIGGTTTDLALVLSGTPLLGSKGASVEKQLTHVKSFAVRSLALGGDSVAVVRNGRVEILPERRGPAYCQGGPEPTLTDALRFLQRVEIGDMSRAAAAMGHLAGETGQTPAETAADIAAEACQAIVEAIQQMFIGWEQEPAYRVWEIVKKTGIRPNNIVGVGGAARGIIPDVARLMGCNAVVPEHAEVANALGAAVAQPTITVNLRVDTEQGQFTVVEDGSTGTVPKGQAYTEEDAIKLAQDTLYTMAENLQLKEYVKNIEVLHSEVYNMVRGWSTTGRIYDVSVQTPRDILFYLSQEEPCEDE